MSREEPLEQEMATLSSILAWKIPWTEKSSGLLSKESDMTERFFHFSLKLSQIIY